LPHLKRPPNVELTRAAAYRSAHHFNEPRKSKSCADTRPRQRHRVQWLVRPVCPKPSLNRTTGMGGKGHKGAWRATDAKLPRSLTTVYPRRCD